VEEVKQMKQKLMKLEEEIEIKEKEDVGFMTKRRKLVTDDTFRNSWYYLHTNW
jgi:hypothetical protein